MCLHIWRESLEGKESVTKSTSRFHDIQTSPIIYEITNIYTLCNTQN